MTTATPATSRPFVLTITARMLRMQAAAAWVFFGVLGALTIAFVVGSLIVTDRPDSAVQFVVQPTTWFAFAMGIVIGGGYLKPFVANGVSRSVFWRAGWLSAMITALVYGVMTAVALVVERWAYSVVSWPHDVSDTAATWWMLPIKTLLFAATGGVSGLLVAIAYHRAGAWRGTFLLPLTLLPVLTPFATSIVAGQRGWSDGLSLTAQLGVAVVAVLLGTAGLQRAMRQLPITPSTS